MSHAIFGFLFSFVFFAVAAILMTPTLRGMVIARTLAIFFAAEGLCTLLTGIMLWIHDTTAVVMNWVHLVVVGACAAYLFYELCVAYRRGKDSVVLPPDEKKD